MDRLFPVRKSSDILPQYEDSPIGKLLRYHNLGVALDDYAQAELLIGMCMDNRKSLRIPENFAFILRAGGANLKFSEFKVSYAVAIGGVQHIALIGHTQCGMVNLFSRQSQFISGLVENGGWKAPDAAEFFIQNAPAFEIGNEIDFVLSEVSRLRMRYPKVQIAPLLYLVEDNLLYQIREPGVL